MPGKLQMKSYFVWTTLCATLCQPSVISVRNRIKKVSLGSHRWQGGVLKKPGSFTIFMDYLPQSFLLT